MNLVGGTPESCSFIVDLTHACCVIGMHCHERALQRHRLPRQATAYTCRHADSRRSTGTVQRGSDEPATNSMKDHRHVLSYRESQCFSNVRRGAGGSMPAWKPVTNAKHCRMNSASAASLTYNLPLRRMLACKREDATITFMLRPTCTDYPCPQVLFPYGHLSAASIKISTLPRAHSQVADLLLCDCTDHTKTAAGGCPNY